MHAVTLQLSGHMRWNVAPTDPVRVDLKCIPGVALLNPLVFTDDPDGPQLIPLAEDKAHLLARNLTFLIPRCEDNSHLLALLGSFLYTLRLVSRQAASPTDYVAAEFRELTSVPDVEFPSAPKTKGYLMGRYNLATAVTMGKVEAADEAGLTPNLPIAYEILLDALRACEKHYHREAILYAAIAVESLARSALLNEYERILLVEPPPAHTNVLSFAVAGGGTVRKDPILDLILGTENFARLLHEAPLYLLRRSMLHEVPELYRRSVALYRTRNRLSHGKAIVPSDGELLATDETGAFQAVRTAVEAVQWFGVEGFHLPIHDAIEFWPYAPRIGA